MWKMFYSFKLFLFKNMFMFMRIFWKKFLRLNGLLWNFSFAYSCCFFFLTSIQQFRSFYLSLTPEAYKCKMMFCIKCLYPLRILKLHGPLKTFLEILNTYLLFGSLKEVLLISCMSVDICIQNLSCSKWE